MRSNLEPAGVLKSAVHGFVLLFVLAGCSSGFQAQNASEEKTFTDEATKAGYKVLVEKPTFQDVAVEVSKETRLASDPALAASIKNVRLDMDDLDSSRANFKVSFQQGSADGVGVEISSLVRARSATSFVLSGVSSDGRFHLAGMCAESFCEHASFVLREAATKKYVFIEYTRTLEYLKPEDLGKIQATNKDDRELLNDVIEYHLPITRHAARIAGRDSKTAIVDLLIVARPAVDAQDESFDEEESNSGANTGATPAPQQPKPEEKDKAPAKNEEHTIELEAVSEDSDSAQGEDQGSGTQSSSSTLTLTSNPYDVYKIKIPTERLKSLDIRYPSVLLASFEIVPAENQRVGEPAHRIALIAEAFVESDVKIFMNACNIYVRAVMMLAGYTKGGTPLANQFGSLFQTRGQGLNQWERATFKNEGANGSSAANQVGLQGLVKEIPDGYATVAQWVRSGGKHGHVGILARLDNKVYFMDGTLNNTKRGLKKVEVTTMKSLTNDKGRKDLTVYGMKGVIKPRRSI